MINGAHVIIYSRDAEADRTFFKDVLGFNSVDVGGGWLIFALPPASCSLCWQRSGLNMCRRLRPSASAC